MLFWFAHVDSHSIASIQRPFPYNFSVLQLFQHFLKINPFLPSSPRCHYFNSFFEVLLYHLIETDLTTKYFTSIGRFAVDREFVNIENSLDHFGPRWCPRSPRGAPRGPFLGQDGEEEPQGDHFCAKMVPKIAKRSPKGTIFGPRWCSRSPRGAQGDYFGAKMVGWGKNIDFP